MSEQITNYKCPACTGPLHFDSATGKVACDYCGSTYSIREIEELYGKKDEEAVQAMEEADAKKEEELQEAADAGMDPEWLYNSTETWGGDGSMKSYNCPSCGAVLVCDETTAATSCPYCGNPTMIPGTFAKSLKPDLIIPFKTNKDQAIHALKSHYQNKPLLPDEFSNKNHIEEIKGVYVPFWLFDGRADVHLKCDATLIHTHETPSERITETDHFLVTRGGNVSFEKIPVDASTKMPDAHMDAIEPFDYSELKPFSMSYLPGFLADKYDVTLEDASPRADERAKRSAADEVASAISGYVSVTPLEQNVRLHRGTVKYALLPVWLLSTKFEGQNYLFAMNGQTGKLIGDLPSSKKKESTMFRSRFLTTAAVLTVIFSALGCMLLR